MEGCFLERLLTSVVSSSAVRDGEGLEAALGVGLSEGEEELPGGRFGMRDPGGEVTGLTFQAGI